MPKALARRTAIWLLVFPGMSKYVAVALLIATAHPQPPAWPGLSTDSPVERSLQNSGKP
jgi:hypothetical protein